MRKHLSYANVTATLALVVAISGGTAAIAGKSKQVAPKNSVTSKSIRNGAIKEDDLAKGSVTASRLAPIVFVNQPDNAPPMGEGQAIIACPDGARLLGGGVGGAGPEVLVSFTGPRTSSSWEAKMKNSTGVDVPFTGYAACLSGTP